MNVRRVQGLLIAVAGLLGAAGVSLAAVAAHVSDSTALRAAAEIAMVHAAAVIAIVAIANHAVRPAFWRYIAAAMLLGAALFTVTVSLGVLTDFRTIAALAPIGGSLAILAWIAVAAAGLCEAASSSKS